MTSRNKRGLIIIPDITGFTEFLYSAKLEHAQRIVTELLDTLIESEQSGLTLCEVEGDGLLFIRLGPPPDLETLYEQVALWFASFHEHLDRLKRNRTCPCGACEDMGNLALKVVGHYGEIGRRKIWHRHQIMSKDVILAHRLLKNRIAEREYFLLSDTLLQSATGQERFAGKLNVHEETYPVFGKVQSNYIDLSPLLREMALSVHG